LVRRPAGKLEFEADQLNATKRFAVVVFISDASFSGNILGQRLFANAGGCGGEGADDFQAAFRHHDDDTRGFDAFEVIGFSGLDFPDLPLLSGRGKVGAVLGEQAKWSQGKQNQCEGGGFHFYILGFQAKKSTRWLDRGSGGLYQPWMRILGIDPSIRCTGYGVIEVVGSKPRAVAFGSIPIPAKITQPAALAEIVRVLREVIDEHHPDEAAVESVIYAQSFKTAIAMGSARGAVMIAVAQAGLSLVEYPSRLVKKAATGMGGAQKAQVGFMMRAMLGLTATPQADAADALAVALTHLQHRKMTTPIKSRAQASANDK
jgi:crossover junction endodeoxyribonuclease RuvC